MRKSNAHIPRELLTPSDAFIHASERIGLHWWYWDAGERRLTISPALLKVLGYGSREFDPANPDIYKNIHPEDVEDHNRRFSRLLAGEEELYEIAYRVRDRRGNWQWYYNRGNVVKRDPDGKPRLVGGITMDISGQYRRLMSVVEEKKKFEFIFNHIHEAILVIELEDGRAGKILEANDAALGLLGRTREQLVGTIPEELASDELIGRDGTVVKQIIESGFVQFEKQIRGPGNRTIWLKIAAHAFTMTGENLIVALLSDMTPGKRTEAALRESERLYRTLVEAADDRIVLFDEEGRIVLTSPSYYATLGYSLEDFHTMNSEELIHPEDRERLKREGEQLFREGISTHEYRVRHKKGHYLHVASKNVLIPREPGEKMLVLSISRDITGRRQAMLELERAKQRAEESDRLKSAFLANMSHEIRTPMNSIVGFSHLLQRPELDASTRENYVDKIIRNSETLLALISDIIDLAKIESGQLPILYGKIHLPELIRDLKQYALDELKRLGKTGIRVEIGEEPGECILEADLVRVGQVLKNLINNAIKFTDKGSIAIGCRLIADGERVLFYVRDTGIGISEDHFKLIFEQFRQVDGSNTRKFSGTGLGLAICRNLVEMMGGKILVESEQGMGSCFRVELPRIKPGACSGSVEAQEVRRAPAGTTKGNGTCIMVVDDEPDTRELFRELLAESGYDVVVASSGYRALEILEQPPLPDLVFMDVQMPVLSGTDTLRLIRERYPGLKVVAQSAYALAGDRDRFLADGYDGYLSKPFTEEQLSEAITELIR